MIDVFSLTDRQTDAIVFPCATAKETLDTRFIKWGHTGKYQRSHILTVNK